MKAHVGITIDFDTEVAIAAEAVEIAMRETFIQLLGKRLGERYQLRVLVEKSEEDFCETVTEVVNGRYSLA